ncbi:Cys-Cys-COOH (seleno)protein SaoC [Romboutsia sp.]|uniref:Cys-Cys-COOH (seleno)protein SaoC n=1 Tax=Romboutsia sp. TaxID=1965302 RepID=UPI003F3E30DE
MKHNKLSIGLGILIGAIGLFVYSNERSKEAENLPNVDKENLSFFEAKVVYEDIITYSEEDINNDGKKDLVVVYKKNDKNNETVVVVNDESEKYITKPVLAPKENVSITFKDIDEKDEIEVMISGSKNGNIGHAIYRLQNKKLIDLFGEGMAACC